MQQEKGEETSFETRSLKDTLTPSDSSLEDEEKKRKRTEQLRGLQRGYRKIQDEISSGKDQVDLVIGPAKDFDLIDPFELEDMKLIWEWGVVRCTGDPSRPHEYGAAMFQNKLAQYLGGIEGSDRFSFTSSLEIPTLNMSACHTRLNKIPDFEVVDVDVDHVVLAGEFCFRCKSAGQAFMEVACLLNEYTYTKYVYLLFVKPAEPYTLHVMLCSRLAAVPPDRSDEEISKVLAKDEKYFKSIECPAASIRSDREYDRMVANGETGRVLGFNITHHDVFGYGDPMFMRVPVADLFPSGRAFEEPVAVVAISPTLVNAYYRAISVFPATAKYQRLSSAPF